MKGFKNKYLIAAFLIFSSWAVFAQDTEPEKVSEESVIYIVEPEYPHDFNPHTTNYSQDAQLFTGLYEGLFSYDPVTLNPQFAIATDYKLSRDKKRVTITLRQNAKFSNGEPITATSVRDSWIQLLETPDAPYASMLDIISGAQEFRLGNISDDLLGIHVTGEYTLLLNLTAPANYLPKILCHPAFSIVHRSPTVYSGPYEIMEIIDGGYLVLSKNKYYWDYENVKTDIISIVQCSDADENAFYFNTGLADWIMADVNTDKVINKNTFQISPEFATNYCYFKTSKNKPAYKGEFYPWDYIEFRTAVLEAIPWEVLRGGNLVHAQTLVYPIGDYPQIDGFSYTDVNEAKILMAEARKKYNIPQDKTLSITFEIISRSISEEKLAALKENLGAIGVELFVKQVPGSIYYSMVGASNSDMFMSTWIADFADPLAFLMLFQSDSTMNDSGWSNKEFDALLEKAALSKDSERSSYLAQAEEILLDSGIVLPVYHPISFNVVNTETIGGWASNAFDIHPLKYLYKKQTKSKIPNVVIK